MRRSIVITLVTVTFLIGVTTLWLGTHAERVHKESSARQSAAAKHAQSQRSQTTHPQATNADNDAQRPTVSSESASAASGESDSVDTSPASLLRQLDSIPAPSRKVITFYYTWYASKEHDGAWGHWNHRVLDDSQRQLIPVRRICGFLSV